MVKKLLRIALILCVFAVLATALQDKIIFFPQPWPEKFVLPEKLKSCTIETLSFQTPDGKNIDAVLARPFSENNLENATDALSVQTGSDEHYLLFSHGNAGNLLYRFGKVEIMCQAGFNVLIYDYRGFGRSSGSPDVKGAITDGLTALKYLTDTLKVPHNKIVLYGESLGTGVSAEIMRHSGADFSGLVLESGFASLGKQAERKFPIIGRYILKADMSVIDAVKSFKGPTLVVHSRADEMIPFSDSEEVFAASVSAEKKHHIIENAGHNDPVWENPEYLSAWSDFYKLLKKSPQNLSDR